MKDDLFHKIYGHPSLKEDAYREIVNAHSRVDLPNGAILLKEGEVASEFYIVEKGLFRSYVYNYKGDEITTEFFCSNEILIESFSLFQRMPSKEYFQALSDATVWKIRYDTFQELLNRAEGLREWGRNWATNQLFLLKQRSIDVLTISASDRYLALIETRPQVIKHAPLKYIASYLGVTDTSLSRIRKEISRNRNYLP